MARAFLTRTPTDEHDAVVEAVAGRENELASYDSNVLGYQQQLATLNAALPAAWPAELTKFKGKASGCGWKIVGSISTGVRFYRACLGV